MTDGRQRYMRHLSYSLRSLQICMHQPSPLVDQTRAVKPLTSFWTLPQQPLMSKRQAEDNDDDQNKRRKPNPPNDIIEDMERLMKDVNDAMGDQPRILPTIWKIPRNLLKKKISGTEISTDLEDFKKHCEALLGWASAEAERLANDNAKGSLLPLIEYECYANIVLVLTWTRFDATRRDLVKTIELAGRTYLLLQHISS